MSVHREHPFLDPDRDPVRRLRGRLGGAVTLWTTGSASARSGLTVSSVLVAPGDPARLLGLLDPDSDLAERLLAPGAAPADQDADQDAGPGTAVVQLLTWAHRDLADAFAGTAPAPGGPFRLGAWEPTRWGPRLAGTSWAGVRVTGPVREVGWSVLLEATIEHVELVDEPSASGPEGADAPSGEAPLMHRRGRYVRPPGSR